MVDNQITLPVISICSGSGALEHGLTLGGASLRTVVYVEVEAFACCYLATQMENGTLDPTPIWNDLETLPGEFLESLRGVPGLGLVGGIPCQPWSSAGKRQRLDDERWIWEAVERILRLCRPEWVFLEEVPGITNGGLEHILRSLAEAGFDAQWGCLKASTVGAPHGRNRLFLLGAKPESQPVSDALRSCLRHERRRAEPDRSREAEPRDVGARMAYAEYGRQQDVSETHDLDWGNASWDFPDGRDEAMADSKSGCDSDEPESLDTGRSVVVALPGAGSGTDGRDATARTGGHAAAIRSEREVLADSCSPERREEHGYGGSERRVAVSRGQKGAEDHRVGGEKLADSDSEFGYRDRRNERGWTESADGSIGPFPPGPSGDWTGVPRCLWPALSPEEEAQLEVRELAHGPSLGYGGAGPYTLSRVDMLRLNGNSVVPLQVAEAFRILAERILE